MIINHNLNAMNSHRQMGVNLGNSQKSMEKLSSGLRINRAGDDAAGLSISEKMRGQIRGLNQASRNAQDGISLIQTAEGALDETHAIAQRMRELAVQSANDTNVTADRTAIAAEIKQLTDEIDRISTDTEFNTQKLLNGSTTTISLQVGANKDQTINVKLEGMDSAALSIGSLDLSTNSVATAAIKTIDAAIEKISTFRSNLGAVQNRLEHTIKNVNNAAENTQAAESRVRDVDMAKEMMEMTKNNVLQQASQSMLAQANQNPQQVLQLLR